MTLTLFLLLVASVVWNLRQAYVMRQARLDPLDFFLESTGIPPTIRQALKNHPNVQLEITPLETLETTILTVEPEKRPTVEMGGVEVRKENPDDE